MKEMDKDPKDKNLNQERVEKVCSDMQSFWIDNGYQSEFTDEHGITFSSPFHMTEEFSTLNDPEISEGIRLFQTRILRTNIGQRYVLDLAEINPFDADRVVYSNAKDTFWNVKNYRDISQKLPLIKDMSSGSKRNPEFNMSGKFVRALMSDYLFSLEDAQDDEREMDRLANRRILIFSYFEKYGSRDIEYWTSEEGVRIIHLYSSRAGREIPELFRERYEAQQMMPGGVTDEYKEYMERFEVIWSTLELPGLAEGKYEKLRDSFVRKLQNPNIFEIFGQSFGKGRKQPYLEMLRQIHKYSKDKNSIYQEVSKKFMQNLLLDPDLYPLAEGLRRISEEEKDRKIFKKHDLDLTFEEVFEASLQNREYLTAEWYRNGGADTLTNIYFDSPQIYLLIVEKWLDMYANSTELSKKERAVLGARLEVLFSLDMKELNKQAFKHAQENHSRFEKDRVVSIFNRVFGKEYEQVRLKENLEFFESTQGWAMYWKGAKHVSDLTHIFNTNERVFDVLIAGLVKSAPNTKSANYFDNVRMINQLGRKMEQEAAHGVHIEEDKLGDIRDETERIVVDTAFETCTVPEVRITLVGRKGHFVTTKNIFKEYCTRYSDIVEKIPDEDILELVQLPGSRIGFSKPLNEKNTLLISSLGFELEIQDDGTTYLGTNKEMLLRRALGILVSPTLYEWREDDKVNRNQKNDRVRSLFFVPSNLEIEYVGKTRGSGLYSQSGSQKQHFIQNYLQWYIEAKYLTGDLSSFNTVVSTWLADQEDLRRNADIQKEEIRKKLDGIWEDFTDALGLTYQLERFKRYEVLKRLLLATNIEEIVPLITSDITQVSLLASSILKGTLEAAQQARVFRGIQKVTSTLSQQFEGSLSMTYLSGEKLERIQEGLKKLGFKETEEGLQMFRHIWKNLLYLRGTRGSNQTLRISAEGLSISNPSKTMYPSKKVSTKNKKGEIVESYERQYDGGKDKVTVTWAQIRQVGEVSYDYVSLVDFAVRLLTSISSIRGQDKRPEVINVLEEDGPANIVVKLPGREQPLFEIFAVKRPKEVWRSIMGMADLMAEEEGPATLRDLLQALESD